MDNPITSKRITYKRKRPNPLFQDWLEELHEEAKTKKSKLESILKEALDSIICYPLPLQTGADCAILKGFNKKLCLFMDMRLEVYNYNQQIAPQGRNRSRRSLKESSNIDSPEDQTYLQTISTEVQENQVNIPPSEDIPIDSDLPEVDIGANSNANINDNPTPDKQNKTANVYKPMFRTGSYAILIALLEHSKENFDSLSKEALIDLAQKHSEESFTKPKPKSYYTGWSNMSRLITKGLIKKVKKGRKSEYMLTDQGTLLAEEVLEDSKYKTTNNEIIFNDAPVSLDIQVREANIINAMSDPELDVGKNISPVPENNFSNETHLIEMAGGSFDIVLLIDKNETSGVSKKNDPTVVQFNKYPSLKHEYRSLKVGDFTWIARSKVTNQELVLPYIVERKRMDDFGASIKDGRFHEQKFRLRKCGLPNVIYMVENYGSNRHVGLPISSLMQALANTRIQDGFQVHTTTSLTNSAKFLAMMTKRLTIEYKDKTLQGIDNTPNGDKLMTFTYFNKYSSKNKTLTVTETFIKILLQLKGVSVEKALAITNKHKTIAALMEAYRDCAEEQGEMLLANIKYNNLGRKIGPTVSKVIYKLLSCKELV